MTDDCVVRWREAFDATLRPHEVAGSLKGASLAGRLAEWTSLLTGVVLKSCLTLGWRAAAKGHPLHVLPQVGQEYLGMDLMAFEDGGASGETDPAWRFPVAVFELENSRDDNRVAYSLWKVLCVRAPLRVVFAYRKDWEEGKDLIRHLTEQVVGPMPIDERMAQEGETLIVLGSRGEGDTFPHGYFKTWRLNRNVGQFEKL